MDFIINLCYSYKVLTACSIDGGGGGDDDDDGSNKLTTISNNKLDPITRGCGKRTCPLIDIAFLGNREMS